MKILIAGLGLIGGSFALALRDRGIADEILGVEKSDENAAEALRLGLADRIVTLEEGVPQADLVVLATPVDTIPLMAIKALNHVTDRQVVMDMGSIKSELCEVITMHAHRRRFVAFELRGRVVSRAEKTDPTAERKAEDCQKHGQPCGKFTFSLRHSVRPPHCR